MGAILRILPSRLLRVAVIACLAGVGTALARAWGSNSSLKLIVSPKESLVDSPTQLRVRGAEPRTRVTVVGAEKSDSNRRWISRAVFRADAAGGVDVSRAYSIGGTYRGRDAMGLFWSMRPRGSRGPLYSVGLWPRTTTTVRFAAILHGRVMARVYVTRRTLGPDVHIRSTTLQNEGFVGRLYARQPNGAKHPGILLLGGSGGGFPPSYLSPLLASHGYPTLALAYFGERGLPRDLKNIPLEYFEKALGWLAKQPGVDARHLVTFGGSRGGEAALLLGSIYSKLVHAVVAYSPSSVVYPGLPSGGHAWLLHGKPLPSASPHDPFGTPAAVIPVERINGPIFLVAGGSDLLWPSAQSSRAISQRLRTHGRRDFSSLLYPRAGHLVDVAVPYFPVATVLQTGRYGIINYGGSTRADAVARSRSWPKLLRFLRRLS